MKRTRLAIVTAVLLSSSAIAHDIGHPHEHVEGGWNTDAGFVSDVDVESKLWNPRNKSQAEIKQRAKYLTNLFDSPRSMEEEAKDLEFREKFKDSIFINSVLPSSVGMASNTHAHYKKALKRNKAAGVTMASTTVFAFIGSSKVKTTVRENDKVIKEMGLIKVDKPADIRQAKAEGNMAVMYNTQGSDFVIDDVEDGVQGLKNRVSRR